MVIHQLKLLASALIRVSAIYSLIRFIEDYNHAHDLITEAGWKLLEDKNQRDRDVSL